MRRLTFDPAVDGFPVWSADGATIAFETARKGNVDRPSDHAFELTKEREDDIFST
jgi:Tol biopolymer transport system component